MPLKCYAEVFKLESPKFYLNGSCSYAYSGSGSDRRHNCSAMILHLFIQSIVIRLLLSKSSIETANRIF